MRSYRTRGEAFQDRLSSEASHPRARRFGLERAATRATDDGRRGCRDRRAAAGPMGTARPRNVEEGRSETDISRDRRRRVSPGGVPERGARRRASRSTRPRRARRRSIGGWRRLLPRLSDDDVRRRRVRVRARRRRAASQRRADALRVAAGRAVPVRRDLRRRVLRQARAGDPRGRDGHRRRGQHRDVRAVRGSKSGRLRSRVRAGTHPADLRGASRKRHKQRRFLF